MADAYLLETSTDRYLLEDGSGVYLHEVPIYGTEFVGGSLGAAATHLTEPFFTSTSGTLTYADGGGGRQGVQPTSASFGQLWLDTIYGLSDYGFTWKTRFVSSTATTTYYPSLTLRNGTTILADVGLRNASGNRHAAFRNNFTYIGEASGDTMTAGEVWSFRVAVNGTSMSVEVWDSDVNFASPGTPTYTWGPATMPNTADNFFIGPGAATGVVATLSSFYLTDNAATLSGDAAVAPSVGITASGSLGSSGSASVATSVDITAAGLLAGDGAASRATTVGIAAAGVMAASGTASRATTASITAAGSLAAAGTLTLIGNTYADDDAVKISCKTDSAATVRLEVTPSAGGATTGANFSPDSDDYATLAVTGLTADTEYDWEILVDGVSAETGSVRTMPAAGSPESFNFAWGSCFDTNTSGAFALMDARDPLFFAMLGDWGYQYITGGPNGNTSPTDVATVRTHREAVLSAATPQAFFSNRSISYTYSDCDGAGANSDGTTGGHATGAVQAAYRQQFAHPTLPLADCGARSWVIGRVRFIQTDETALASAKANTDNSSKTKLGTTQKTWFKDEIDDAAAAGQLVIWLGDGPWIESTSLTGNTWRAYNTERTELGAYIAASGVSLIRLHGDTHTLFYDDGTNNWWGGFPTASAAPIHTTAQPFGTTVSGGKWPTSTTNSSRQYGIAEVVDLGNQITVTLRGWSSTNAAPTEVERFTGVFVTPMEGSATRATTVTVTSAGRAGGAASVAPVVTRSAAGSATGTASRATTVTLTAAGSLGLAGTSSQATTATVTASGATAGTASRATAMTLTAVGQMAATGSASRDTTATLSAAGAASSDASRTVTVSITAAGSVSSGAAAHVLITAALTADGQVAASGSASRTVSATVSATGACSAAASRSVAVGVTAAGVLSVGSGAQVTATVTISAAGQMVAAGVASRTVSVSVTVDAHTLGAASRAVAAALTAAGALFVIPPATAGTAGIGTASGGPSATSGSSSVGPFAMAGSSSGGPRSGRGT